LYGFISMWWSIATTVGAYLLGLNPFDQPGVESYKKLMHENLK
jgi:glucose-6-phosphate isomerase